MTVGGHILPDANGTNNLGSSSLYWSNLYVNTLNLKTKITTTNGEASSSTSTGDIQVEGGIGVKKTSFFADKIYSGSTSYYIDGDATSVLNILTTNGQINAGSHIIPDANNANNLGSSSYRWKGIYSGTLNTSGGVTVGNKLTVTAGGATITAGGLTVTAGGMTVNAGTSTFKGAVKMTEGKAASSTTTGALQITGGLSTTNTSWFGGGLITVHNSSSGDSAIVFDRGTSANWKIVDSSATLHFQSDWNSERGSGSEKGAYETLAKLAHTTGHLTLKGTLYVANGTTYYINGSTSKLNALTTVGAITVGTDIVPDATYSSSNTANNIGTSSARWNALYIQTLNAAGNATISGNTTMAGTLSITSGADSSSMTTGALKVQAGIGATGQITAKQFMVNNKATMKYDTANDYVYFTFA